MFSELIVPLDGSIQAERALPVAEAVAQRLQVPIRLVSAVGASRQVDEQASLLERTAFGLSADASVEVLGPGGHATELLAKFASRHSDAMICMTSFGRGHTGALLGSVAEGLIRHLERPMLLVGPGCTRPALTPSTALLIAIDGSPGSGAVASLGGAWAATFDLEPWVVNSIDPEALAKDLARTTSEPPAESATAHRFADRVAGEIGRTVNWEVLHGHSPAAAIVDHAEHGDASLIAMGTHGETGLHRLATGSVCAATVHRAPCPVLVQPTIP